MIENEIYIFVVGQRTFGGRAVKQGLNQAMTITDCVEFMPMMDNRGGMAIIGILIGDLVAVETITENLIFKVDKKSTYYQSYIKTTSGIEISNRGLA